MTLRPRRTAAPIAAALTTALASSVVHVPAASASPPEQDEQDEQDEQNDLPADDRETAKQLAQDGRELFWKAEYRAAINAFTGAYDLVPDPNLLFNISTAYEKLGEYDDALEYLDRYAIDAPDAEQPAIAAKRAELEALAANSEAPSHDGRPSADEPSSGEPDEAPSPAPEPEDPAVPAPAGATPPKPRPPVMGALGWSLAGATTVALGVGVGLGVSAGQLSRQGASACEDMGGALRCPAGAEDDLDRARRRALGADIAFGVAAAAGVATLAVIGVRLARRNREARSNRRVRVSAAPGGAALRF